MAVVSTRPQSLGSYLGTICSGEEYWLHDGRHNPVAITESKHCLAILYFSDYQTGLYPSVQNGVVFGVELCCWNQHPRKLCVLDHYGFQLVVSDIRYNSLDFVHRYMVAFVILSCSRQQCCVVFEAAIVAINWEIVRRQEINPKKVTRHVSDEKGMANEPSYWRLFKWYGNFSVNFQRVTFRGG